MSIDVAVSGDRNVIKTEAEKILKYKDLTTEIQRTWNVKAKVTPVVIRTDKRNHTQNMESAADILANLHVMLNSGF